LSVGAIQQRKNQLAALAAAQAVGLPLVVVGPSKDPVLAGKLRESGATLRGYVTPDELASLYRGAALLVFPSRYEGFGLPVLEAMASGTPVVAVASSSIPEVAGDAAILVPPDAHDLAAGIERALAERERLVAAGLERAAGFSWAETARQTAEVYRKLV
jgi:glycosyltransferase involved in cell wall biosynthesis